MKIRKQKERQVLVLCQTTKKVIEHETDDDDDDDDTSYNWCAHNGPQRFDNLRISQDNPNNSITNIDQNTEKSAGYLRRLVIIQTPVKDYQLMLV